MPITNQFQRLPLEEIWIDRGARQRKEIDVANLLTSIARRGVLNPVLVLRETGPKGERWKLIAGERRFEACRFLDHLDIPARFMEDLSPLELQIVELEENTKRQDLTWQEIVATTAAIHTLYGQLEPTWTQTQTADALGIQEGTLSIYLRVAGEMDKEIISASGTVREAYNHLARKDQRAQGVALQELIDIAMTKKEEKVGPKGGSPGPKIEGSPLPAVLVDPLAPVLPPASVLNLDFIPWAAAYSGPKFNFIHCDFPYGVNLFAGPQGKEGGNTHVGGQVAYNDSPDSFFGLLEAFCRHFNNFAAYSCHLMFWYSEKNGPQMRQIFREHLPGMIFTTHPLIWLKTDNLGISPDPKRLPRHIYETALVGSRGDRQIVQTVADAYGSPTDKALHASAKPEPMLRHFFRMFVDETTSMLDPTCGAGSSLRAAESLGAPQTLGIEIDPANSTIASRALAQFRVLEAASKSSQRRALHAKAEANPEVTSRLGGGLAPAPEPVSGPGSEPDLFLTALLDGDGSSG